MPILGFHGPLFIANEETTARFSIAKQCSFPSHQFALENLQRHVKRVVIVKIWPKGTNKILFQGNPWENHLVALFSFLFFLSDLVALDTTTWCPRALKHHTFEQAQD